MPAVPDGLKQITAFLREDQIDFLDGEAENKGINSRQPIIRWAIDHYRDFLLSQRSTYQIDRPVDQPDQAAA